MPITLHTIRSWAEEGEDEVEKCYFKRWNQSQSISAKGWEFVDTIGSIIRDGEQFEIFFVKVSYGPFHPDPKPHANEDNIKLGKDSIDRIGK
ncbi:4061_t:CDS:2 [Gigaspora margarita]|uniref:4061_t:CDS:1 n=1 Tax=Gigaspora margarita TaxID=4874 RepID=A0ABM8VY30_GIGMA|nr:4061_t:CDS:2 [Gigaspora margarita]